MVGEAGGTVAGDGETVLTPLIDPSTNWVIVGGSLQSSIAFDTISSFDDRIDGEVSSAKGSVFLRAPDEECGPCEINLCFRQKHDIYRIYVRSTARVYEVYHSLEQPIQSNEYVCTVRCGKASAEILLPEIDDETIISEHHNINHASVNSHETIVKGIHSNGSDEDGWIEVKVPDSPLLVKSDLEGKSTLITQSCYEATAEISDLSPCMSLTLRLLLLQTKGCVHIEEIYIYADPSGVVSSGSSPSLSLGTNFGGASLLSMLVPGLLQLPKSGNNQVKDDHKTGMRENSDAEETEKINRSVASELLKETYFAEKRSVEIHEETSIHGNPQNVDFGPPQELPASYINNINDQKNVGYGRIEMVLEELLSRVGKIETFCSCFEEKMTKPLVSMEMKLEKLEQQLGVLSERTNCSMPLRPSRFSVPEFSRDDSDHASRDHATSAVELNHGCNMSKSDASACKMYSGVVFRAPEYVKDDSDSTSSVTDSVLEERRPSMVPESKQDGEFNAVCDETLDLKRERNIEEKTSIFIAHEFSPENNSSHGDAAAATFENHPNDRPAFSIDMALASALEAFLSSTVKPQESNAPSEAQEIIVPPEDVEISNVFHVDKNGKGSKEDGVKSSGVFHMNINEENDILDYISDGTSTWKGIRIRDENVGPASNIIDKIKEFNHSITGNNESGGQTSAIFGELSLTSKAVDAQNDNRLGIDTVSGTHEDSLFAENNEDIYDASNISKLGFNIGEPFADSDEDEGGCHHLRKWWFGESSSESIVDGPTIDSSFMCWDDLSSADSVEVKFTIPSWLTGRGSDCEAENIERTTTGNFHSNAACGSSSPTYMNQEMGNEAQHIFSSVSEIQHGMPVFEASLVGNHSTNSMFMDLMSNMEDICNHNDNSDRDESVANRPLIDIKGSRCDTDGRGSSTVTNQPLVDVEELFSTMKASSTEGQGHLHIQPKPELESTFSSLI